MSMFDGNMASEILYRPPADDEETNAEEPTEESASGADSDD